MDSFGSLGSRRKTGTKDYWVVFPLNRLPKESWEYELILRRSNFPNVFPLNRLPKESWENKGSIVTKEHWAVSIKSTPEGVLGGQALRELATARL